LLAALVCFVHVDARSSANVDDAAPMMKQQTVSTPGCIGCVKQPTPTVSTSGTHGCIDCVIGPCHQCLCREALKTSSSGVANVLDIFNKAKNQYLVCEGSRITCHPCPKGLVWNCQKQVCDVTGDCPPIPEACSCDCGLSKKTTKSYTMSTFTTTSVTTTANTDTSTTVSYQPIHAPFSAASPDNANTEYDSRTVVECYKMSGGHKMSVPCEQVDPMLTKASVSVWTDSARNSTTVKTNIPCSRVTTTTTSASAPGSPCPAMKTTITVSPCKGGAKTSTDPWINSNPTEVLNLDVMAFKRCLCDEAMKTCTRSSRSICYPKFENKFLTCHRDGRISAQMCPPDTWWNEDLEACSTVRKCNQAFPVACLKYKFQ